MSVDTGLIEVLRSVLGWCAVINIVIVTYWFVMMSVAGNWVYRMHSRWFPIPQERFIEIHYVGMMRYKLASFMFTIVPYLALLIVF
ncbi:DUF6868 family protein [Pseudomaricurvus sp.]|uniref:DUF6868 family protein n=1 Tax=Pseudomaricurvus sp. TaxID=2004510 RepID=UPI003F6D82B6